MKNRYWTTKRKRVWVLCTAMLTFLTGCRAVDRDNQFEMPPEDLATLGETRAAETAGTERAQDGAEAGPESLSVPYQYGNMQMNVPSGNFMAYGDKVIFATAAGNGFDLFTVDKKTLEVRLLCQDASCNHRRSECISYQKTGNLEQYDGRIFVLGGDLTGPVLELKVDHFETVTNGDAAAFWHGGGDLYVKTPDSELLVYEKGSKSPKTLVEEYPAVQNVGDRGQHLRLGHQHGFRCKNGSEGYKTGNGGPRGLFYDGRGVYVCRGQRHGRLPVPL